MSENYRNKENSYSPNISADSLSAKKKVALVCCSNGLPIQVEQQIQELVRHLRGMGLDPILSPCIYAADAIAAGTALQRAEILMQYYRDPEISAIYDISGGDIANEILSLLDYDIIANSNKMFWGYSDLTTVINAIYAKTGIPSVLYQVKNIVKDSTGEQTRAFQAFVDAAYTRKYDGAYGESMALFQFPYKFVQGDHLEGIVLGGNIRCLIKLAGTPYWPDMTDKILLLEARSGGVAQMTTYLSQLQQMGVFDQIHGILLGTFTAMERDGERPDMSALVRQFAGRQMPIAKTWQIGHGADSKAIRIGHKMCLEEK